MTELDELRDISAQLKRLNELLEKLIDGDAYIQTSIWKPDND